MNIQSINDIIELYRQSPTDAMAWLDNSAKNNTKVESNYQQQLLNLNTEKLEAFKQSHIISFLKSDKLASVEINTKFYGAFKVFCNYFQKFIFARQATTFNNDFSQLFLEHLKEEIGHNELIEQDPAAYEQDPILNAASHWFLNKMLLGSDLEKLVIMHLCIEEVADLFHLCLKQSSLKQSNQTYVECHVELDHHHANMGNDLLIDISKREYDALSTILEESWNMMELVLNRVAELAVI